MRYDERCIRERWRRLDEMRRGENEVRQTRDEERDEKQRGTEVNTRECIVCGERAGSVAILRIARRRFCFRSRCPRSFSALRSAPARLPVRPLLPPTPFCLSLARLSFASLLSSEARSYVKFGTATKGRVMCDLTGRARTPSLSLSLFAKPASQEKSRCASSRILLSRTVHIRHRDLVRVDDQ